MSMPTVPPYPIIKPTAIPFSIRFGLCRQQRENKNTSGSIIAAGVK